MLQAALSKLTPLEAGNAEQFLATMYWFQSAWSGEWLLVSIMAKELAPIVLSCAVWRHLIARKRVLVHCNNHSVVDAINKATSKEPVLMHLLQWLQFFVAYADCNLAADQILGKVNVAADLLSQNQVLVFCE